MSSKQETSSEPELAEEGIILTPREAGKAERRRRIIRAARDLIRETGDAGLSMRSLASKAGVSLVTPYNLFGSKRAIVLALLEDVRIFRERFAEESPQDPLDRIFAAIDMAVSFYIDDPQFYRTLWSAVFDTTNEVREEIFSPKRDEFWKDLTADLKEVGCFEDFVDQDILLHQLDYQFRSIMLDWVIDDIDNATLGPTARLGYALVMRGVATPKFSDRLLQRIEEDHKLLSKMNSKSDPLTVLPTLSN